MNDQNKSTETESKKIPCKECMKQVPKSEAQVAEASDYVLYFCGLECYDKWQKENGEKK